MKKMEEKKFKTFGELTADDVIYMVDRKAKTITEVTGFSEAKKQDNGLVFIAGQALDTENTDVAITVDPKDSHCWNGTREYGFFVNLWEARKFIGGGIETLKNLMDALAIVPDDIEEQLKAAGISYNQIVLTNSNLGYLAKSCKSVIDQYRSRKDNTYDSLIKAQNDVKEKAFNALIGKVKEHSDSIYTDEGYSIYIGVRNDGKVETIKAYHLFIDKYDNTLKAEGTLLGSDSEERRGVVDTDTEHLLEAYREIVEQEIRSEVE